MKYLKIAEKKIGDKNKCFIVAEISANHNSKLSNAIKLIREASKAGANAVKLQTYKPNTITLDSNKKDFLINKNSPWSNKKNYWNLYKKGQTPWSWNNVLFKEAKKNNIIIFSSVFDETSVDHLEKLNCPAYKIASPEINHIPLIKKVAKTGKPIILSTGLSNLNDIRLAVNTIRKMKNNKIIILKCTTSYPAPLEELNLKTMEDIKKKFKTIIGFSDHSLGNTSSLAAVALGAKLIEKHFNILKNNSIASFFSSDVKEFSKLVLDIRNVEKALGKVNYEVTKNSKKHKVGMRSIYVSKNIKKGEVISKENIKIVRPNYGLQPKFYFKVLGKKSKKKLKAWNKI